MDSLNQGERVEPQGPIEQSKFFLDVWYREEMMDIWKKKKTDFFYQGTNS